MYDNNMKTNDLKLVKPQEEFLRQVLFMKDDDRSALAIVKFECTYSQQVKIVIKNYS